MKTNPNSNARVKLDWSKLLGFDQVRTCRGPSTPSDLTTIGPKVGIKTITPRARSPR